MGTLGASTPAATTPGATTLAVSEQQRAACLVAIEADAQKEAICEELVRVNIFRAEHNANPLEVDPTLCTPAAAKAAELAQQNDSSCSIQHNSADLQSVSQGENLY